ncbi:hypothetical protein ACP70R_025183 [Stipagrostis hirtigluma subsp. patula]
MEEEEEEPRFLPDDVLEDVLRRLAARSLAVCRCVCSQWRAVADARCTPLRADLLPVKLGGIFVNLRNEQVPPAFFARPSAAPKIAGKLGDYVEMDSPIDIIYILQCCNGLLLLDGRVVNPATRQWVRLPCCPATTEGGEGFGVDDAYLAFDPTISPHFDVLLIQNPGYNDKLLEGSEWPPLSCMMCVYSSRTGRWEERLFAREGEPAGTLAEVRSSKMPDYCCAVYWQEALYVHYKIDFVLRITLSNNKYEVIKLPVRTNATLYEQHYLEKSRNGVHLAIIDDQCRLEVFFLNEVSGKKEWVLKHDIDIQAVIAHFSRKGDVQSDGPWILQDYDYCQTGEGAIAKDNFEWDSDDDNATDIEDRDAKCFYGYNHIFGFHPYREVIFLHLFDARVVAYHFNSSKVQDLGEFRIQFRGDVIDQAFIYTPCLTGELSGNNL